MNLFAKLWNLVILTWTFFFFYFSGCKQTCVVGMVQKVSRFHALYQTVPKKHGQLHFLNEKRLSTPQLIFFNGIGSVGETVIILASKEFMGTEKPNFAQKDLNITTMFNKLKWYAVDINPDEPAKDPGAPANRIFTGKDPYGAGLHGERSVTMDDERDDIEERLARNEKINDQFEAESLIFKRRNKFNNGELPESIGVVPRTFGLLPVAPVKGTAGRPLTLNSGILYRMQSVQTLIQSNETTEEKGEWITSSPEGKKTGHIPHVGEYFGVSIVKKRSGTNPFITSEENSLKWKNTEYRMNRTRSVLWMFVPTEYDKFYEIRNRNYPASLLVWNYDIEEGEFVLNMETRREYLKRYRPDGVLRQRALFSFQIITETYEWELRQDRPKFQLITYNANHVYSYESIKKKCTMLIVRNSATNSYTPEKTDKFNRPLDMFYITRLNLTGKYTASIFSFMYDKSIVDVFAKSAEDESVVEYSRFQLANRSPYHFQYLVIDRIPATNEYKFMFRDKFKRFQWVTVEAHVPSFGVAPFVLTGIVGNNTNTQEITRKFQKIYKLQDRINMESGYWVNASVMFQSTDDFRNSFTALMEVTEPADRLYWDKAGKPGFIRLSMPGALIEKTWSSKANFTYDRVIERREAAFVVQIRGTMTGSYGLRAFVRKQNIPYGTGIATCEKTGF